MASVNEPAEPATIARIGALYAAGVSYRAIGKAIGKSKSAIAGLIYRHRGEYGIAERRGAIPTLDERLGWDRVIAQGCRWIDGDPAIAGWSYCGQPCEPGQDWCAHHRARVWRPAPQVAA